MYNDDDTKFSNMKVKFMVQLACNEMGHGNFTKYWTLRALMHSVQVR